MTPEQHKQYERILNDAKQIIVIHQEILKLENVIQDTVLRNDEIIQSVERGLEAGFVGVSDNYINSLKHETSIFVNKMTKEINERKQDILTIHFRNK